MNITGPILGLDYYIKQPTPFLVIINVLSGLAVVANILHLIILNFVKRKNRRRRLPANYETSLAICGFSDLTLGFARLVTTNTASQDLMIFSRVYCILSAVIVHSDLLIGCSVVLLINIDRILVFIKGNDYQNSFYIKHYRKFLLGTILFSIGLNVALWVVFRHKGYRVKGVGACRMGSELVPSLDILTVGIIFIELIIIFCCCIDLLRRTFKAVVRPQIAQSMARRNKAITKTILILVVCMLLLWLPIMITMFLGAMKIECLFCEWIAIVASTMDSLATPLIYGMSNQNYVRFVKAVRRKTRES